MAKNNFDLVMDYIDAHIDLDLDKIKEGIYKLIGYNSHSFGECFKIITRGKTLNRYINERRLYFAAQDLIDTADSISEIASKYYSEQSALTRAMKTFFNCTPDRVRKGLNVIPDNKYSLADFIELSTDEEIVKIAKSINDGNCSCSEEFENEKEKYEKEMEEFANIMAIYEFSQEYGVDIDTLYLISDLAYKLDIPFGQLTEDCLFYMDKQSVHDNNPFSPSQQHAINCGINSDEELEKICEYFNCKWYDLDPYMVEIYQHGPDFYE